MGISWLGIEVGRSYLDSAFGHFFRRCRLKKEGKLKGKVGYPKFKSEKQGLGSFRLTGSIAVFPDAIQLPRLGRLCVKERDYLPTSGVKMLSATVRKQAGHWYVSVQVEQEQPVPENTGSVVGVNLGGRRLPRSPMAQSSPTRATSSAA